MECIGVGIALCSTVVVDLVNDYCRRCTETEDSSEGSLKILVRKRVNDWIDGRVEVTQPSYG